MFEKSLYDLIRGLRNHRGNELEYIQNSLRECKIEIKSQDTDKKAIALLKLIYLEMFGYDMSWASFHVLEVMSSAKYLQKRVGYLAAAQSFRADTDVLMLATNLLKKDIVSASVPNLSLPLATLPHIITPSLAMSLLSDVLSRISHSSSAVRKKTVVSLYRLSLVYPETLRLAWPKIKERLMDVDEDSSVTAAVVNVICELGWRRPHDFLPLAPRFFELLVDGGNNWMAIKIIKLFATLTPLEPRLVRKLIRPLTNIIQTTTAMSLLYECINGIIQGGILDEAEGVQEGDEVASLCVAKLRGMIVMEADPNLKYVALLAFNRIVLSHLALVAMQQDVIMDCLDDADISIRLQALELAVQMVSSDSLQYVVDRLIRQLEHSPPLDSMPLADPMLVEDVKLSADIDDHDSGETVQPRDQKINHSLSLPNDYRNEVLHRILDICSRENYSDVLDFEWYVDILVQLVRLIPPPHIEVLSDLSEDAPTQGRETDITARIGAEIRNVAVRVKTVRLEAIRIAESFVSGENAAFLLHNIPSVMVGILGPAAWLVGEFAEYLALPAKTLNALVATTNISLPMKTLSLYLQAIPKVFLNLISRHSEWNSRRQDECSLLLSRIIAFFEALATHPDLDVQERTIEFLELSRLIKEAIDSRTPGFQQLPFLVTSVLPNLFSGLELNPVAVNAQKKVPLPQKVNLERTMNEKFSIVFSPSGIPWLHEVCEKNNLQDFYYVQDPYIVKNHGGSIFKFDMQCTQPCQDSTQESPQKADGTTQRRIDRRSHNRDDPFYIANDEESSGKSTPSHQVFTTSNGETLDIDSIPIIDLAIESGANGPTFIAGDHIGKRSRSRSEKVEIAPDETFGFDTSPPPKAKSRGFDDIGKAKRSLLQVDSSALGDLSLEDRGQSGSTAVSTVDSEEDAEMIRAMQEVERFRLEMQRASERIDTKGIPADGTLVKKKEKKKTRSSKTWSQDPETAPGDGNPAKRHDMSISNMNPKFVARHKKKRKTTKRTINEV